MVEKKVIKKVKVLNKTDDTQKKVENTRKNEKIKIIKEDDYYSHIETKEDSKVDDSWNKKLKIKNIKHNVQEISLLEVKTKKVFVVHKKDDNKPKDTKKTDTKKVFHKKGDKIEKKSWEDNKKLTLNKKNTEKKTITPYVATYRLWKEANDEERSKNPPVVKPSFKKEAWKKLGKSYDNKWKTSNNGWSSSFVKQEKREPYSLGKSTNKTSNKPTQDKNFSKPNAGNHYPKLHDKNEKQDSSSSFSDKTSFWNDKFAKSKFSKDKKKWWTSFENNKYSKLKPYDKFKKSKIWFDEDYEEKEVIFSRSVKINKKKEEKKVEDIRQDLTSREWEIVVVNEILSVKELSEKIGVPMSKLIAEFMKNGMLVNINSKIDFDSCSIVAEVFWVKLQKDNSSWISAKDLLEWDISSLLIEDDLSVLQERPPIISIMWHVDHGKTSLLDYIRETTVASWEAGWITQSIWAYQVEKNWKKITFLDTPGHEAFTVMRARWAKSTDIAILVVAADEWVKPQTIESINHAREAWIGIIVAINKMDKEWANPELIKSQLSEHWIVCEEWGWDTPLVPVSAKTWFWVDDLLEMILLVSEMKDLKANYNRNWVATVIESHLDPNLWPVATILINTWTIEKWADIVCRDSSWKIKIMQDFTWRKIIKAFPWDPVLLVWLDKVVEWWDVVQIMPNSQMAKARADDYRQIIASQKRAKTSWIEVLMSRIKSWSLKQLKIVLKADTNWSLEALKAALLKLSTPETNVLVIHSWVWNVTESDVLMCQWSQAVLIAFSIGVVATAKQFLSNTKIEFIGSDIIYHITERIEKIVTWMLDPKEVEVTLWRWKVLAQFYASKEFIIIWLSIPEWDRIEKWAKIRVLRNKNKVWDWKIESLKFWVEEMNMLEWPTDCWIKFIWNTKPEVWDYLEIYKIEIQK